MLYEEVVPINFLNMVDEFPQNLIEVEIV